MLDSATVPMGAGVEATPTPMTHISGQANPRSAALIEADEGLTGGVEALSNDSRGRVS